MTIVFSVLILFGAFLWFGLAGTIITINDSDAAGNGLSQVYGVVIAMSLWFILAFVLIIAMRKDSMSGAGKVVAVLLHPISKASTVATVLLLSERTVPRWLIGVPVGLPLVLVAYSLWAYFPSAGATLPAKRVRLVTAIAVLALSTVPWPFVLSGAR